MKNENQIDTIKEMPETSRLVSLPQGEGIVFIVTRTATGDLQSTVLSKRKEIFLSVDSTVTYNTSGLSSTGTPLAA